MLKNKENKIGKCDKIGICQENIDDSIYNIMSKKLEKTYYH